MCFQAADGIRDVVRYGGHGKLDIGRMGAVLFFQTEHAIRTAQASRGLGDVYKGQTSLNLRQVIFHFLEYRLRLALRGPEIGK